MRIRCRLYAVIYLSYLLLNMFYSFIVEIYKIVGMLKTHAFKPFSIDFNIFGSPSFIMAGGFTDFNVVVYGFF